MNADGKLPAIEPLSPPENVMLQRSKVCGEDLHKQFFAAALFSQSGRINKKNSLAGKAQMQCMHLCCPTFNNQSGLNKIMNIEIVFLIILIILSMILIWQFFGYPIFIGFIALRNKPKIKDYTYKPFVSILIPTFNEEKAI